MLRDLRDRGMSEPKLVSGDGALGAWAALRDVFPQAREQRCWVHKTANVLDALPKRLQPRAKTLLHEMAEAPARADARAALERFREEFDAKYPKAVAKLDKDWAQLTAFFDFPAEHWRHLRTTNPIESSFATVKLRTRVTKGAGSKTAALAMAYKLLDAAQERWRRFNGHELVADVLDGVTFKDGVKVEKTNNEKETRRSPPDGSHEASSTTFDNCSGEIGPLMKRDLAAELRDRLSTSGEQLVGQRAWAGRRRSPRGRGGPPAGRRGPQVASHDLAFAGLDALTGVMGRRAGLAALQREMDRSERTGEPLVVAFIDTVGLKTINDSRGHAEGDRVLREVANCITEDLRSYDLVTRVGGDEFVCTLAGQSIAQARERYQQISLRLAERSNGAQITVGLAEYESGVSLADLINRADQAMIGARR